MLQAKKHFGVGLVAGIILATLFFQFFAPRYEILKLDQMVIKQDKWSGDSWRQEGRKWIEIEDSDQDWKPLDKVLIEALKISDHQQPNPIASLRKNYPVLKEFSDQDIMERIKTIYAQKIMVDLYFDKIRSGTTVEN